tara:strand:- start:399 stop:977 length:579 start_codon:yes stop_codon:yes gene_type:complete
MSNLTNQHTQITGELPRLILLDRDGVINQDSKDYIKNAEEWAPIKGSLEAIADWQRRGIEFAVCTNQSGLGKGLFSMDDLFDMHAKCNSILKSLGGKPLRFFFCPHTPENNCSCRKPKALLLELAIEALGSKPSNTVFVGDSPSDLKAAQAASVQFILVHTGNGESTYKELLELKEQLPPHYQDLRCYLESF